MIKGSLAVRAQRLSTSALTEGPFCRRCIRVVPAAMDGSETIRDNPGPWGLRRAPEVQKGLQSLQFLRRRG